MRACRNIMILALTLGLIISVPFAVRAQKQEMRSVGGFSISTMKLEPILLQDEGESETEPTTRQDGNESGAERDSDPQPSEDENGTEPITQQDEDDNDGEPNPGPQQDEGKGETDPTTLPDEGESDGESEADPPQGEEESEPEPAAQQSEAAEEQPAENNSDAGEQLPLDGLEQGLISASILALDLLLPEADEDTVYNEEQLMDWYADNEGTGGTVSLGCNVIITNGNFYYNYDKNTPTVTIDTGEFGLIYDGGSLASGDFMITGEGVDTPVLTVIDPGIYMVSWVHSIQGLSVTATGRDGIGGVAVSVCAEPGYYWDWRPMYAFFHVESLIYSYGAGAVGLELEGPLDVYCLNIRVEGEDSVAVSAPQGVNLYYCKLEAIGTGGLAVSGGDILLDTCNLTPEASDSNVTVIQCRIIGLSGSRFYVPVPLGSDDILYQPSIQFLTEFADGTLAAQTFYVVWDDMIDRVDTRKVGRIAIPGSFPPPFEGLGLIESLPFALELVIDVRDPVLPTISEIRMHDDEEEKYIRFDFWESDAWEAGDLILWRSDDGGTTWYDYTDSDDIEWRDEGGIITDFDGTEWRDEWCADNVFYFYYDEITDPVFFQLEAPGYGESNIVVLYSTDTWVSTGDGGDRTGADRIIGTKPVETTPSNDGNDHSNENGTDDDGGAQPGDEGGSGNSGNSNGGAQPKHESGFGESGSDTSDSGTPDTDTGTGTNTDPGTRTGNNGSAPPEDTTGTGAPGSDTSPTNTDSLFSIPVFAAVPDAPTDSPAPAGETNAAQAQSPIPELPFPLSTAMLLTGSGFILLTGLSIWIKARRLCRR